MPIYYCKLGFIRLATGTFQVGTRHSSLDAAKREQQFLCKNKAGFDDGRLIFWGAIIGLFFVYFRSSSNKKYTFYNKKYLSGIRCQDLNPRPSDFESPPLTSGQSYKHLRA